MPRDALPGSLLSPFVINKPPYYLVQRFILPSPEPMTKDSQQRGSLQIRTFRMAMSAQHFHSQPLHAGHSGHPCRQLCQAANLSCHVRICWSKSTGRRWHRKCCTARSAGTTLCFRDCGPQTQPPFSHHQRCRWAMAVAGHPVSHVRITRRCKRTLASRAGDFLCHQATCRRLVGEKQVSQKKSDAGQQT
jgi:hypothetical protein